MDATDLHPTGVDALQEPVSRTNICGAFDERPTRQHPRCCSTADRRALGQQTQAVRAGMECDDATGCVVPPIHLTSTFAFRAFGEKRGYDYSRSGNPTRDLLGQAIADLEQGAGAVITATGMAAVALVGHLLPVGARIVAPHDCYGGTYRLFDAWRRRGELQVRVCQLSAMRPLCATRCRSPRALLWIETPSNPLLRITDIEQLPHSAMPPARWSRSTTLSSRPLGSSRSPWRRHRRALDDQVSEWPQRCRRRGSRRRHPRAARAAWLVGQLPRHHWRALRQLS